MDVRPPYMQYITSNRSEYGKMTRIYIYLYVYVGKTKAISIDSMKNEFVVEMEFRSHQCNAYIRMVICNMNEGENRPE